MIYYQSRHIILINIRSMNIDSTPVQTHCHHHQPQLQDPDQSPDLPQSAMGPTIPLSTKPNPLDPKQQPRQTEFNRFLPLKFGKLLTVNKLSWNDFKGKIDKNLPWSAHIFWNIQYKLSNDVKPRLSVSVIVSPKSWVREQKKCDHLLNHQQGHLLIGYLCALQFIKHIQQSKISPLYMQYVNGVFWRILKEYRKIERKYDEETDHRLNYQKQEDWNRWIRKRLMENKKIFNDKKGRFVGESS